MRIRSLILFLALAMWGCRVASAQEVEIHAPTEFLDVARSSSKSGFKRFYKEWPKYRRAGDKGGRDNGTIESLLEESCRLSDRRYWTKLTKWAARGVDLTDADPALYVAHGSRSKSLDAHAGPIVAGNHTGAVTSLFIRLSKTPPENLSFVATPEEFLDASDSEITEIRRYAEWTAQVQLFFDQSVADHLANPRSMGPAVEAAVSRKILCKLDELNAEYALQFIKQHGINHADEASMKPLQYFSKRAENIPLGKELSDQVEVSH